MGLSRREFWSLVPRVSVIVVAYNEGESIVRSIERLLEAVRLQSEVIVVVDSDDDTSIQPLLPLCARDNRLRVSVNNLGRGPAMAIRHGFSEAKSNVVVVTMADGCDDPSQIDALALLVERGVVVAAGSRYARGGQQVGAPLLKSFLSRMAGMTLRIFARVGTWDATNSFKAYSKEFVDRVGIESDAGFEVGIELVAKARRYRKPVAEIPTIWLERETGESHFKLTQWIKRYIHWYLFAFGPPIKYPIERNED